MTAQSLSGRSTERAQVGIAHISRMEADTHKALEQNVTIRVITGVAWVTYDDRDFILETGAGMHIPAAMSKVVIGNPRQQPLVYEVVAGN
ncbi:MAG: hypothetical protein IH587_05920 [Anaerolineae bacterium]|nr:hypothetical protein [Anaerolineae bacterium]